MNKTIAIMQPTYLPWLGYLAMIERADLFVFLDNVQFDHRSWQQRNRIKTLIGPDWLSLSVHTKGVRSQLIKDVMCNDIVKDTDKHLTKIWHAYSKAPFFKEFYYELANSINKSRSECNNLLCSFNIKMIKFFCSYIGITKKFWLASEINVGGKKDELLANICAYFNGNIYLSAPGSQAYLEHSVAFEQLNISISYHHYFHPVYNQLHGEFVEGMSCVDALFNVPKNHLKDLIMSGCK